jgi:ABC-type transport system involved in Fe-S cluster assembly fused permease/ATPase subunit
LFCCVFLQQTSPNFVFYYYFFCAFVCIFKLCVIVFCLSNTYPWLLKIYVIIIVIIMLVCVKCKLVDVVYSWWIPDRRRLFVCFSQDFQRNNQEISIIFNAKIDKKFHDKEEIRWQSLDSMLASWLVGSIQSRKCERCSIFSRGCVLVIFSSLHMLLLCLDSLFLLQCLFACLFSSLFFFEWYIDRRVYYCIFQDLSTINNIRFVFLSYYRM